MLPLVSPAGTQSQVTEAGDALPRLHRLNDLPLSQIGHQLRLLLLFVYFLLGVELGCESWIEVRVA